MKTRVCTRFLISYEIFVQINVYVLVTNHSKRLTPMQHESELKLLWKSPQMHKKLQALVIYRHNLRLNIKSLKILLMIYVSY